MDSGRSELKAVSKTYQQIKSSFRERGQLKGLYLNARSIINKLNLFRITVHDADPDIIGVTESWANSEIFDSELILDGYVMFRYDRDTGNKGGGILLYVKTDLKPTELVPKVKFPEHAWCWLVDAGGEELLVEVCYRSPNRLLFPDNDIRLRELLAEVGNRNVVIMEDFKYAAIDWKSGVATNSASYRYE